MDFQKCGYRTGGGIVLFICNIIFGYFISPADRRRQLALMYFKTMQDNG